MGKNNCNPCSGDAASGGKGPLIVSAGKYVALKDIYGNDEALKGKPHSILTHGTGKKPVKWQDGSEHDRIALPNLFRSAQHGATLLMQDNSGLVFGSEPDEEKGKQQLVYEGDTIGWEPYGSNRHCFPNEQIVEANAGCGYSVAAFAACGPDGQTCLVRLPSDQCGSLQSNGTFAESSPAGVVQMYGGTPSSVPAGWLLCDGRIVSPDDYPALYARIGFNFGRSGSNFYLPDMRGAAPRGVDKDGVRDPDNSSRIELNPGGNVAENVGSYQEDAVQCHNHGGGGVTVTTAHTTIGPGNAKSINYVSAVQSEGETDGMTASTCGDPRTANETRMKNVYLNFIISVGC